MSKGKSYVLPKEHRVFCWHVRPIQQSAELTEIRIGEKIGRLRGEEVCRDEDIQLIAATQPKSLANPVQYLATDTALPGL
jgi:hypothetical protein